MNKLNWLVLGVLAAGMLSIAGCGDDDDDDDDDAEEGETEEAAEETEESAEGGAVDVTAVEYEFQFDQEAVTTATTGFSFINGGEQDHELYFVMAEEDFDLEAALALPAKFDTQTGIDTGLRDVGRTGAEAGGTGELVFEFPLSPGRYLMLCFVSDEADGEPHAAKGMVADFTLE